MVSAAMLSRPALALLRPRGAGMALRNVIYLPLSTLRVLSLPLEAFNVADCSLHR